MERPEIYEAVMQELIRGHESASRLKAILSDQLPPPPPPSSSSSVAGGNRDEQVEALMEHISGSFTRSISFLVSVMSSMSNVAEQLGCPNFNGAPPQQKDHRVNIAGRRREYPGAQKFILPALTEDGHCWKKYGQKNILGAKHPRSYFKCSQKKDQGCQAMKQVQMTEDDPPKYLVTYVGQHTCSAAMLCADPQLMEDLQTAAAGNSHFSFLNFESADHHHHRKPNLQEQAAAAAIDDQVFSVHHPAAVIRSSVEEGGGVFSPVLTSILAGDDHEMEESINAVRFPESDHAGGFCAADGSDRVNCKEEMD